MNTAPLFGVYLSYVLNQVQELISQDKIISHKSMVQRFDSSLAHGALARTVYHWRFYAIIYKVDGEADARRFIEILKGIVYFKKERKNKWQLKRKS